MSFQKIDTENNKRNHNIHKILIYGYNQEERKDLGYFLQRSNEDDYMIIEKFLLDNTVEDLLGAEWNKKNIDYDSNINYPDIKFMLLCGFSQKEIHDFLDKFKQHEMQRPLMATLTPTNI
ncbi:MAG TPA: DUF3783 domain-containing protein, partial [Peptostreptococcaceae bacterium]|nr:DUF3783 domain-containing protein [Peptostreptococcaceae bacterium]